MKFEYTFKSDDFKKENIEGIKIILDNGDYFPIYKNEISNISLSLSDKLVWKGNNICPVVNGGCIKLKINHTKQAKYNNAFLYNYKEYIKDRKTYIEDRCTKESKIVSVDLYDDNNWNTTLHGEICAFMEGDFLTLSFGKSTKTSNLTSAIMLNNIQKSEIRKITLDFENCDTIDVYDDEIIDIKINFNQKLDHSGTNLIRTIKNGILKIKFDKEINYRNVCILAKGDKQPKLKDIEKRICGNKSESSHDICNLYINYDYVGYGIDREERISIDDIRSDKDLGELYSCEDQEYDFCDYIGGYAKKEKDGSITIFFGKSNN